MQKYSRRQQKCEGYESVFHVNFVTRGKNERYKEFIDLSYDYTLLMLITEKDILWTKKNNQIIIREKLNEKCLFQFMKKSNNRFSISRSLIRYEKLNEDQKKWQLVQGIVANIDLSKKKNIYLDENSLLFLERDIILQVWKLKLKNNGQEEWIHIYNVQFPLKGCPEFYLNNSNYILWPDIYEFYHKQRKVFCVKSNLKWNFKILITKCQVKIFFLFGIAITRGCYIIGIDNQERLYQYKNQFFNNPFTFQSIAKKNNCYFIYVFLEKRSRYGRRTIKIYLFIFRQYPLVQATYSGCQQGNMEKYSWQQQMAHIFNIEQNEI